VSYPGYEFILSKCFSSGFDITDNVVFEMILLGRCILDLDVDDIRLVLLLRLFYVAFCQMYLT
jgi:hypothetical protein